MPSTNDAEHQIPYSSGKILELGDQNHHPLYILFMNNLL
jgi:hypothetical protein